MQTFTSTKNEKPIIKIKLKRRKALNLLIFSAILLLIYIIFSNKAIKLYEKYFVNDHQEVLVYIENIDQYDSESTEVIDNIRLNLYRTSQGEYSNEVKRAENDLQQLIKQTADLKAPKEFNQHKNSFIALLHQRRVVLSMYKQTKKSYVFQRLNTAIRELNQKLKLENISLLKAFKKAGIDYKLLGDGSTRYWYKSHSAKSIHHI